MTDTIETIREALARYEAGMAAIGGCGDGGCVIVRPTGQHTNGGCHCYSDRRKASMAMSRASFFAAEIRKALHSQAPSDAERERCARNEILLTEALRLHQMIFDSFRGYIPDFEEAVVKLLRKAKGEG